MTVSKISLRVSASIAAGRASARLPTSAAWVALVLAESADFWAAPAAVLAAAAR